MGGGNDTINDYDATDRNNPAHADRLVLPEDVSYEELWFKRSGNHLQVSVEGAPDVLTISNWYSSPQYQVERIEAGSSVLLNHQVEQLVAAMATYGAPSSAGNVIPQETKDALQPVFAETWGTPKD